MTSKPFWNSGTAHSPLADAIMIGNIDVVKELIPHTKINANPKNRFGTYLHVAALYGRVRIFKHICGLVKEWKDLKDKQDRNVRQFLIHEDFKIMDYDHKEKEYVETVMSKTQKIMLIAQNVP